MKCPRSRRAIVTLCLLGRKAGSARLAINRSIPLSEMPTILAASRREYAPY
jgi:hypothetical protein